MKKSNGIVNISDTGHLVNGCHSYKKFLECACSLFQIIFLKCNANEHQCALKHVMFVDRTSYSLVSMTTPQSILLYSRNTMHLKSLDYRHTATTAAEWRDRFSMKRDINYYNRLGLRPWNLLLNVFFSRYNASLAEDDY